MVVNWPGEGKFSLVREACKRFGVTLPAMYSRKRGLARLRRGLTRLYKTGHRAILIIDHAESMRAEDLLELPAITGFQKGGDRLVTVILMARPDLRATFDQADSSELRRQLRADRTLPPLSVEEVDRYIQRRLTAAGAEDVELFEPEAVALIHEATGGVPRRINQLCETALMVAHGAGDRRVDRHIITTVAEETLTPTRSIDLKAIGVDAVHDLARRVRGARVDKEEPPVETSEPTQATPASTSVDRAPDTEASMPRHAVEAMSKRMEGLLASADEMTKKLERMLARADRMTDTSEAALLQSTAVEKHLASLTDDADSVISGLGTSVQRAGDTLGEVDERSRRTLEQAEQRAQMLEARLSRVTDAMEEASERTEQIEKACEQAERVESNLTTFAEQLADKADVVQERVAVLVTTLETGEHVRRELQTTVERAQQDIQTTGGQARQELQTTVEQASTLHADIQGGIEDAIHRADQLRGEAIEQAAAMLKDASRETKARCDELVRNAIRDCKIIVDGRAEDLQESADAIESRARTIGEEVVSRCADASDEAQRGLQAKLDASIDAMRRAGDDARQNLESAVGEVGGSIDAVRRTGDGIRQDLETSIGEHRSAVDRMLAETRTEVHHLEATTGGIREQAEETIARFRDLGDELIRKGETAAGEMEQRIAGVEDRSEMVRDTAGALDEQLDRAANHHHELNQGVGRIDSVVESLERRAHTVRETIEHSVQHGERIMLESKGACSEIDVLQREISNNLLELSRAREQIGTLTEQTARGEQTAAALAHAQAQGERLVEQLSTTAHHAGDMRDTVERFMIEAENRTGQLDSHNAAAQNSLGQLTDANRGARGLIDEANETIQRIESATAQAQEQTQVAIQAIDETTARAQEADAALEQGRSRAEDALNDVNNVAPMARELAEQLGESIAEGQQLVGTLAERCGRASEIHEHLAATTDESGTIAEKLDAALHAGTTLADRVAEVTGNAREVEQDTKTILEAVRTAQEELSAAAEIARGESQGLRNLKRIAEDLIQRHEDLQRDSERMTTQLEAQLAEQTATAENSAASGRHLLAEFATQAQSLSTRIHELRVRTEEIESAVSDATARPVELVAAAQTQAAQLERVCAAVRKVFAGLSGASLDAKQQTDAFEQASRESAVRLEKLTSQTNRASSTLQEWIEEAVQVQGRLERTLERAPSIRQTHPSDELLGMSRSTAPPSRIANPTASRLAEQSALGDLRTLGQRETGRKTEPEPAESPVTTAQTRAEEVSQLIEDAKRAAVATKV